MRIKYYGTSHSNDKKSIIGKLYFTDGYRNEPSSPSWSVWIVPGTVNADGNPIE